jgi:phosphoribosylamine---glycine ligase
MGAVSPVPLVDEALAARIRDEVLEPTVRALAEEGVPYVGVVYAGLIVTSEGPKVLEYNARFGDPEAEVLLPRLETDLVELCLACAEGRLEPEPISMRPEACVTVVLASGGYPGPSETGFEISGLEDAERIEGVTVFHAGTAERRGRVVTAGGRVLSVSGLGDSIAAARERAYEAVSRIAFDGMRYRSDIGARAAEEAT